MAKRERETPHMTKRERETPHMAKRERETPHMAKRERETPHMTKRERETPHIGILCRIRLVGNRKDAIESNKLKFSRQLNYDK